MKKLESIEDVVHATMNAHEDSSLDLIAAAICKGILAYSMTRTGGDVVAAKRLLEKAFHLAMDEGPSAYARSFNRSTYEQRAREQHAKAEYQAEAARRAKAEQYGKRGAYTYGFDPADGWADGGTFSEETLKSAKEAFKQQYGYDPFSGARYNAGQQRNKTPPPPPPGASKPWWQVLGVSQHADKATIKGAWRKKIKTAHPDAGGDAEAAQTLNAAKSEGLRVARS